MKNKDKQYISILGCGWLGMPLTQDLIKQGYQIKASTTSESKLQKMEAAGITPFLINIDTISEEIQEFLSSEILIIAITSKNIEGFKNLIHQIEKSNVKKLIFISSTSVYDNAKEMITEVSAVNASVLSEIEKLFLSNSHFLTTIVRFGGLFGYNRKPALFFSKGKKIGNPDANVNMIHRDDSIRIIKEIINKNIWNETLNACTDSHPTRREFYSKAALEIGLDIPSFEEAAAVEYKVISNQKLKSLLTFEFKYPDLLNIKEEVSDAGFRK